MAVVISLFAITVARENMLRRILLRKCREFTQMKEFSDIRNEFVIKSPLEDVSIPYTRLTDRLWKHVEKFKNHIAIECAESNKKYTYERLQHCSAVFATSLRKKFGLQDDDVAAVMLPNSPEFPVVTLGTLQAGCIVTTINPDYKEYEICHQVTAINPKLIITVPECYEKLLSSLEKAKKQIKIIVVDSGHTLPNGAIKYSEVAESGEADYSLLDKIQKCKDDIAVIPFSSGTTGLPKGVMITYGNLLAAIEVMMVKEYCFPMLTNGIFQDVVPCILPFFHIYGLVVAMFGHFANGCKLVTLSKFTPNLYLNLLKTYKPTLLYVVPPIAILLGKHPDVNEKHFERVRHIVSGAAPLAATDAIVLLEKGNGQMEINQGYGATETTALITTTPIGIRSVDYAACGIPMASIEIKVLDPITGKDLPADQSGELCVRSPTVMKGYYKNEQATRDAMTDDGFFKTGDLGHYDPHLGLYVSDRIKELIKVKGMQVAPAELEGILRTHPAVQEAAVIGVPHVFNGEMPKAFIIKKSGLKISRGELQNFVAEKVSSFKKIEEIVFVNKIPMTASGKILRRELKEMYG